MRRDMDLIREILLKIEQAPSKPTSKDFLDPNNESESQRVLEHLKLIEDAGFITGRALPVGGIHILYDVALTWSGHDFVDAVRDPKIWQKTKKSADEVGGWTVDLLKELAIGFIKKQVEDRTGVKL